MAMRWILPLSVLAACLGTRGYADTNSLQILRIPLAGSGAGPGQGALASSSRAVAGAPEDGTATGVPVYYLFSATGSDENYFNALAVGKPSLFWDQARRDVARTFQRDALSGTAEIVPVRIRSAAEFQQVMSASLVPPVPGRPPLPYFVQELTPGDRRIAGFAVISHSGGDGPVLEEGPQLTYGVFQDDAAKPGPGRILDRILPGAILRFAGCNSGNDHMWYENDAGRGGSPSVAHGTAAVLAEKDVEVYGKRGTGDVARTDTYFLFKRPDPATPYPVRHIIPKDHYRFYVAQDDEQAMDVPYGSDEEKEALLQWYEERGIQVVVNEAGSFLRVTLRLHREHTQGSRKPEALVSLVEEFDVDPGMAEASGRRLFGDFGWHIRRELLARAIDQSRRARGALDMQDFRLWAVLLRPDHDDTVYRADLCDDPVVKDAPPAVFTRPRPVPAPRRLP